jgi:hypothetical protein
MTPQVWVKLHGVPVPRQYIIEVKQFLAEAPVGTKGWQRRAVRKALYTIQRRDDAVKSPFYLG